MDINNETVGISAEIAIADSFGVPITDDYRRRGEPTIIASVGNVVAEAFDNYNIPHPIRHIAEGGNPVDFLLHGGATLSVKTNMKKLGMVAPQRVGQVSSVTYFQHFRKFYDYIPQTYMEKTVIFKETAIARIDEFMEIYWENLFDCDYLLYFYNVLNGAGVNRYPDFIVLNKRDTPVWEREKFTFTKTAANWNESCTIKYAGVSIGEFQIHNNRDNFKFRFKMSGILKLSERGEI